MDEAGAPMVYNRQQREAAPQSVKASNGDSNGWTASLKKLIQRQKERSNETKSQEKRSLSREPRCVHCILVHLGATGQKDSQA